MLRRPISFVAPRGAATLSALRFSVDTSKTYDHSASFSRGLTAKEDEAVAALKNRTVSGIVPGKLFMRHWIAGEQATVSIYNRALSLIVTFGLILWAGSYSTLGFNTESAVAMQLAVFFAIFLVVHTHMMELYGVFLGAYAVALALGY